MKSHLIKTMLIFFVLVLNAAAGEWDNAAFLTVERAGASAVVWQNKIYVFGGKSINNSVLNSVEIYDPTTMMWDSTIVAPFSQPRYNAGAVIWDNKIYLLGGRTINDVLANVEIYDPAQNTWTTAQDLRKAREGHSACAFNDRIYAIGGQKGHYELIDEIEWFDAGKQDWEAAIFDLPHERSAHFSAVYDDEYFMFGGYYWGLTKSIYKARRDSSGYVWENIGELSEPRAYGSTARIDSLIFIIAGETSEGKTNLVEIFNAKTGELTRGDDMNMSHSGMATAVLNNQIYALGGYEAYSNNPIRHVHRYTPNLTAVSENDHIVRDNALHISTFPNPFRDHLKISITSPQEQLTQAVVVNSRGQFIRKLTLLKHIGDVITEWDGRDQNGRDVASGVYLIIVETNTKTKVQKVTYVK